jgi:hypothetical protein
MVEKELGAPIDELFSEFSAKPIAAASLAQVRSAKVQGVAGCRASSRVPAARVGSVHAAALSGPQANAAVISPSGTVTAATPRGVTCLHNAMLLCSII